MLNVTTKSIAKIFILGTTLALAGCSTGGSMGGMFSREPAKTADIAPEPMEPAAPLDEPAAPTGLSEAQIRQAIGGKSWRWAGPNNSGVTLYAKDGNSLVEVNGKGTTKGKWVAKDGQLCESFAPAPFLPGGVPMSCAAITGSGKSYTVGKAKFTPA